MKVCPYCKTRPVRQQKYAVTCGDPECVRRNRNSHKQRVALRSDNIDTLSNVAVFDRVKWRYVRPVTHSKTRVTIMRGWTIPLDVYYSDGWSI